MDIFSKDLAWHKGNLHTHTTLSDGKLTPDECVQAYKKEGYDFLCITDHRKYFEGFETPDFVVLPGEEFMFEDKERWTAYHIVGIGQSGHFETDRETPPQAVADGILARGGIAVMGHPAWSLMTHDEIAEIEGISAMEVFSGVSEEYTGRGNSANYADVLATMGKKMLLLGVDDMHFFKRDFARAYIWLQTNDFSKKGIMDALRKGSFYASEGPQILGLTIEDGHVTIDTSSLSRLFFMSNKWYNGKRVIAAPEGESITRAEYDIHPDDRWLRIEGTDNAGRKFTTNFLNIG